MNKVDFETFASAVAKQAGHGFSEQESMTRESFVLERLYMAYEMGKANTPKLDEKELEDAANDYADNYDIESNRGGPRKIAEDAFEAGAKWMREKLCTKKI
jgi:hypothetical protein